MKRILLFSLIFVFSACTGRILDELDKSNQVLDERIDQNEQRITKLLQVCDLFNTNIASLQRIVNAMEENDFVKTVEPITDESGNIIGYSITMLKTGVFTVYNGVDGIYPEISVRKDESDGLYYWTLNGDWLYSSDNEKIRAVGVDAIDPQFKIVDGNWLLSSDGGVTWEEVGPAQGKDGWSFFSDFSFDDQMLTLTLPDGTVLSFPRYMEPEITFYIEGEEVSSNAQIDTGAASGVEIIIPYTITDQTGTTMISASSDGYYSVKIQSDSETSGKLIITSPSEYCDGFVNVILFNNYGLSKIRVITFSHK